MAEHAVDVTSANFEAEVIEASKSMPVVVDFWAPWCAPCRVLKPVLEKLAAEYGGKFKLAKLNTEDNQDVATTYGVRSIPDVMAFRDGKPVSHFLGAVPESQVRAFIDKLIPTPSEIEQARALALREAGELEQAEQALRRAIDLDGANFLARLDLTGLLNELGRLDEAQAALATVHPNIDWDDRIATLRAALTFARAAESGGSEPELKEKIGLNPADHEARFALACLLAGKNRFREALEELIEIVRLQRNWNNDSARKQILAIFSLAQEQPGLVAEFRKKLASVLN